MIKNMFGQTIWVGIGIILLNIGMYFLVPAILIVKLRERFSR